MTRPTIRCSRRSLVAAGTVAALARPLIASADDPLAGVPDGPLRDHLVWFIDALNDTDGDLGTDEIEAHFSAAFLAQVPPDQVSDTIGQLRQILGTVSVGRVAKASDTTQAGVQLIGSTGVSALLTVWLDPETSLLGGLLIEPDTSSPVADATASAPAVATPATAAASAPDMSSVVPAWQGARENVLAAGRNAMELFMAGDDAGLAALMTPEVAGSLRTRLAQALVELTTDRVHFELPEVGAVFDGHVQQGEMGHFFYQRGPGFFQLTADDAQSTSLPEGRWRGQIVAPGVGLETSVAFSGSITDLAATLTIESQNLDAVPLDRVTFEPDRPIGDAVAERALPLSGEKANNIYSAAFDWGGGTLVIDIAFNGAGQVTALQNVYYGVLPPDPAGGYVAKGTYRLPFDGAWTVLWGGETEFLNYHASTPGQRHAYDLAVWRDGATCIGDGTRNEQYHAWGQPVLAPASGTVVSAWSNQQDIEPNQLSDPERARDIDPSMHPAGNHVVIEAAEGEYVLVGHLQAGSVRLRTGDTVRAGDVLGLCGNSGNSSEPHVHIQLQNGIDILSPETVSLPLPFADIVIDGEAMASGMPTLGQVVAMGSPAGA